MTGQGVRLWRELSREPEALRLRLEAGAKNFRVHRVCEAVAHEGRVIVFDIHVELLDMVDQEIQNLAVVAELPPRQHHLIRAFLVELAQPSVALVALRLSVLRLSVLRLSVLVLSESVIALPIV